MSYAEKNVFICNDLRKLIFSYLRKYPKKQCYLCADVIIWDKKAVKQYIDMSWVQDIPIQTYCIDCWGQCSYMGPTCKIS